MEDSDRLMENQQTDQPMSDEWREGRSQIPTIELANSLRSLKKLVGAITERNCEIRFNSGNVSYTEEREYNREESTLHMRINPEPAFRSPEYPISGDNFDVLAGYAAHEAMHIRERSFDAFTRLRNTTYGNLVVSLQSSKLGITPNQIYTIGEEIYVDARGKEANKVIGQYIEKARKDEDLKNPYREVFTDGRQVITFESLLQTWCSLSVYGRVMMPDEVLSLPYEIQYNLEILLALSAKLSSGNEITPNQRADTYLQTFYELKYKPEPPAPDEPEEEDTMTVELDNQDYTYDPDEAKADNQQSDQAGEKGEGENTSSQEEPKEEGPAGEGGGSPETKDREPDAQHKPDEGQQEEQKEPNGEQEKEEDSAKEKLEEPSGERENQMEGG